MTLHCDVFGAGPDVVLIHGWGWHGGVWTDLAAKLARDYRLWVPDLPGHGRSDGDKDPPDVHRMAESIGHRLPTLATWVGWSLGALVALAAAQRRRAQKLVLIGATPRFTQAQDWHDGWTSRRFEQFSADVSGDPKAGLERFAGLHLAGAISERALLRKLRAELFRFGMPEVICLQAGLQVLRETDLRSTLPEIEIPSLVVSGEHDRVVPWQAGRYLAQSLPRARFERVVDAGHALPMTHGEYLEQVIREFLHA